MPAGAVGQSAVLPSTDFPIGLNSTIGDRAGEMPREAAARKALSTLRSSCQRLEQSRSKPTGKPTGTRVIYVEYAES